MIYNYCTLFDSNYLTRGIAMLESLNRHTQDFHLYILAFDTLAYNILTNINHPKTTIISMEQFETPDLLQVKQDRTRGEYCWTCTPFIIDYCIQTFNLSHCTYLDADLYFFDNPNILIDEMQDNSVLLTKHNYTPKYNQEATSGIYCVQFMTFKATQKGLEALQWWKDRCFEWCYARFENGKFGDQKYLDDWTQRFEGVHVLQNIRGGLAPWNIQQYHDISPIFYHFHHLKFIDEDKIDLCPYFLPPHTIKTIYAPYIQHLLQLRMRFYPQNFDGRTKPHFTWKTPLRWIKRKLLNTYNIYNLKNFGI
ncbi:glycosyl transferase [Helicobacter enhydrae]|uniref:Glycosyl transferase n=1 Tax=Helicobacter enhydrae TaxID=222136 RepID=A0A1B1U5Q5_9HELI|nr:glycosyl transferase [Helicobacter enhydrae]ANV98025.1 glycosyl transferase [Helicobacter enhydrae]